MAEVKRMGGLQAIALSHSRYYSAQVEWAEAMDVPIFIHENDQQWVVQPSKHIQFWLGEKLQLSEGITLHRLGGHFKGGTVLHWENSQGILLTGDIIQVVADRKWVSFMYSYPNLIPLPAKKVAEISEKVSKFKFERLYNAFHRVVGENAEESVKSTKRGREPLFTKTLGMDDLLHIFKRGKQHFILATFRLF